MFNHSVADMTNIRVLCIYTYEQTLGIVTVLLTKNRKQHPPPGDDASTAEAAPGRVGEGEQGEARRAKSTPNGGPHVELGRLRLKTWSKCDFSIAQTTGQHILYPGTCYYRGRVMIISRVLPLMSIIINALILIQ